MKTSYLLREIKEIKLIVKSQLKLEKPRIWEILKKKPGKTWNFEQKSLKNPVFLIILTWSVVKFRLDTKNL